MTWFAGVDRDLPALLVAQLLAVRPLSHLAVGGALDLRAESEVKDLHGGS